MASFAAISPAASSGLASLAADAAASAGEPSTLPVSLYVHVPFCVSKCAYCDFYSIVGGDGAFARFVDAVLFEAGHWSHFGLLDDVPTLYLGGGTPTVMGEELVRLVRGLSQTAGLRADVEVTVETNPETTHTWLVDALVDAGVSRFSLGVQSFDDEVLATLGRCHDAARAKEAAAILRGERMHFSVDLMCGVPGQSFESWERTLESAVSSGARHASVYPLSVEPGTTMSSSVASGRLPSPDPDVAADMMLAAEVALDAAGMPRYEVSNYAQPGFESRHNTVYWTGGAYLGLGPGASSMLPHPAYERVAAAEGWVGPAGSAMDDVPVGAEAPVRTRFAHARDVDGYIRAPLAQPAEREDLDPGSAAREDIMLGLRLVDGVTAACVEDAGLTPVLERLAAQDLVRLRDGRWATSQRGWLLGNEVFSAVWAGE